MLTLGSVTSLLVAKAKVMPWISQMGEGPPPLETLSDVPSLANGIQANSRSGGLLYPVILSVRQGRFSSALYSSHSPIFHFDDLHGELRRQVT